MNQTVKKYLVLSGILWTLFVIFTGLVIAFDVKMIGLEQSMVGFATINHFVFQLLGVHLFWYEITDWLGLIAIAVAFSLAITGMCQLIRRKSIRKVDRQLLVLGGFYMAVIACYIFFEGVIINYRPVLLGENLEASYPSSHTMIVTCIMATAPSQFRLLWASKKKLCRGMDIVARLLIVITVLGRLISGVHWFTDIVGGLLLSAALVVLYGAVMTAIDK